MNELYKYDFVLAPSQFKDELISLKLSSLDNNFKIIDKNSLIKNLCFSYDDKAVLYLYRKGIKLKNTKSIIESMYFLKPNISSKVNELIKYKKELKELGYIKENYILRDYYKNKNILVIGYNENDKLLNLLKDEYNLNFTFYSRENNKALNVYCFKNCEDEIRYLFEQIFDLYLNKKIPLNKIKVAIKNDIYRNLIDRYQQFYNIHFNFKSDMIYFNTEEYKVLRNMLETTTVDQAFSFAYDKFKESAYLEKVLSKYIEIKDVLKESEVVPYFDYVAKNIILNNEKYRNGIDIISLNEAKKDDYVFLLGFEMNSYPQIFKDNDYLSDDEKYKIGIPTSIEEQQMASDSLVNQLYRLENLKISFASKHEGDKVFPSLLIDVCKMNMITDYTFLDHLYSKRHFEYFMGKVFDDERNFSYRSPYINSITKEELSYLTYDSSFKRFMIEKLKMPIRLSASALDVFYTCPFKYYLSYCCNASYFKDSIYVILGKIAHKMIEDNINGNLKEIEFYMDNYSLTNGEKLIILQNRDTIKKAIDNFNGLMENTKLKQLIPESKEFSYKTSLDDTVIGRVDLIMHNDDSYAVLDFKTGVKDFSKTNIEKGLDMQLIIYYLLLNASDDFENKRIVGLYYNQLIDAHFYAAQYDYLKLRGLTIGEGSLSVIQGNEPFVKSSKSCDEEYFNTIVDVVKGKIDDASKRIHNSDFNIAPIKKDDCKKCEFYDTCFVNLIPQLNLEEEKEEE